MNFGKQALSILETVAPTIATALGGPVAGLAVQELEKFFGVKGDQALDAAVAGATPEQMAQLKKIDNDFRVQMAQIGFSEDKLRFDDTASARAREIAVRDQTPSILAYGVTAGFFGVLAAILKFGVPAAGGEALLVLLGSLGTAWAGVMGYYFGSSAGSVRKDKTIADIAKQP